MNVYEQVRAANLATAKEAARFTANFPTFDTPPWLAEAARRIKDGEELTTKDIEDLQGMGTTDPVSLTAPVTR